MKFSATLIFLLALAFLPSITLMYNNKYDVELKERISNLATSKLLGSCKYIKRQMLRIKCLNNVWNNNK